MIDTQAFRAHGYSVVRYSTTRGENLVLSRDGVAVAQAFIEPGGSVRVTGKEAGKAAAILREHGWDVREVGIAEFLSFLGGSRP